jgi:NADH-quinone oxidoreductase subunit G
VEVTKLDEIATQTYRASPDSIARLGFAIAHMINPASPGVENLSEDEGILAQQIATALATAKNPVIISGCSSGSESVLRAVANLSQALCGRQVRAGVMLTVPECNNIGLALLGGHRLESAFGAIRNGYADVAIILENDLYRRADAPLVDKFLQQCKQVIAIDHLHHPTSGKADILLPAGTFAESDGTLVNNEGRAQRFYQVYQPVEDVQESWRWLMEIGRIAENPAMTHWKSWDEVIRAMGAETPPLQGVETVAPPARFRVAGQKIPRAPHRYSGRTSMLAGLHVSEPKPPEDPDSPLSFTMEGYRGQPPSSVIPFFWSPGWNSVQSVAKYQEEVGGPLRGGDPGVRLLKPDGGRSTYFLDVPERFKPVDNHLLMLPLHHIFGSEEMSVHAPGVAQRVPKPYVAMNAEDAQALKLAEGSPLDFIIEGKAYQLPVKVSATLPKGTAGMPNGLPGEPYIELPRWAILKQDLSWKRQPQTTF